MGAICENTNDPLDTALIASWLESFRMEAAQAGVTLTDLRESQLNIPTVAVDYGADRAIGRIAL